MDSKLRKVERMKNDGRRKEKDYWKLGKRLGLSVDFVSNIVHNIFRNSSFLVLLIDEFPRFV